MKKNLRKKLLFSARTALLSAALLLVCLAQSCEIADKAMDVSADDSDEHEGGPSAEEHKALIDINIGLMVMFGVVGSGLDNASGAGRHYATEDPTMNPFDRPFAPVPAVKEKFRLSSALEFVQKGSKSTIGTSTTTLSYLEFQEDALYYNKLSNGGAVYGGLGPYFAYGLGGSVKGGGYKAAAFGGDGGYKRFDAGLNLTAGYMLPSSLRFSLGYDLGLYNKSPAPDYTSRNRSFSINVGYSIDKIVGVFSKK